MRTPMHLAYGILVPEQAVLARAADRARRCTVLQHATIPYLHGFIETRAREDELTVFVPVQCELLGRRGGHREHGGGQR